MPTYFLRCVPPSFTGRAEEIKTIVNLLTEGERVVNIIGAGGQGKTALVLKAASILQHNWAAPELFPHGIVHLNFYEYPDISRALTPFVNVFTAQQGNKIDLLEGILAERSFLFVMDGTENISDVDDLRQLLDKMKKSRACLLYTSDAADE